MGFDATDIVSNYWLIFVLFFNSLLPLNIIREFESKRTEHLQTHFFVDKLLTNWWSLVQAQSTGLDIDRDSTADL